MYCLLLTCASRNVLYCCAGGGWLLLHMVLDPALVEVVEQTYYYMTWRDTQKVGHLMQQYRHSRPGNPVQLSCQAPRSHYICVIQCVIRCCCCCCNCCCCCCCCQVTGVHLRTAGLLPAGESASTVSVLLLCCFALGVFSLLHVCVCETQCCVTRKNTHLAADIRIWHITAG